MPHSTQREQRSLPRQAEARARRLIRARLGTEVAAVSDSSKGCDQLVLLCDLEDGRRVVFKQPREELDKIDKEEFCCVASALRGVPAPTVLARDDRCLVQTRLPGTDLETLLATRREGRRAARGPPAPAARVGAGCADPVGAPGDAQGQTAAAAAVTNDGDSGGGGGDDDDGDDDILAVYFDVGASMARLHSHTMPWFGDHISSAPSVVLHPAAATAGDGAGTCDAATTDAAACASATASATPTTAVAARITKSVKERHPSLRAYFRARNGGTATVKLGKLGRHRAVSPAAAAHLRAFLDAHAPGAARGDGDDSDGGRSAVLLHYDIGASNIMVSDGATPAVLPRLKTPPPLSVNATASSMSPAAPVAVAAAAETGTAETVTAETGTGTSPSTTTTTPQPVHFAGLIDFGDAGCGAPEEDFSVLFAECYGTPRWRALLGGYASVPGAAPLREAAVVVFALERLAWALPEPATEGADKSLARALAAVAAVAAAAGATPQ